MRRSDLTIPLLSCALLMATGLAAPLADALPQHPGSPAGWLRALSTEAAAQPAPDDDPDDDDPDEDDDSGGDDVGDDDVGNDGAAGPAAPPGGPDAPDDDDAADDDDAPVAPGPAAGPADDDDDDDAPAPAPPPAGPGPAADDNDDDAPPPAPPGGGGGGSDQPPATGTPRDGDTGPPPAPRDPRRTGPDAPPGGSGVRGVSPDGEGRIRDGDGDRSRPSDLPAGVDLDDRGQWVRAGEVLALSTDTRALARARALGFREVERTALPALGMMIVRLRAPAGRSLPSALSALRAADPDNAYDFNHLYRQSQARSGGAAAPARRSGRNRARTAPQAAQAQAQAPRGVVGMIDGPVAPAHPALAGAQVVNRSFVVGATRRDAAHGTAVASLLVGQDGPRLRAGLAGGRLLAADVVSAEAAGFDLGAAAAIVRALDWIIAQGGPVVNISLAGPPNALLEEAVRRAVSRGVLVVAAVGNDGPAAPPRYPAAYPDVIGVTAVDGGGVIYRRAARGSHVDLAAPGVNVVAASTPNSYQPATGTSFAAPAVAAMLARMHRRADAASASRAVAEITARARDAGAPGRDPVYGAGIAAVEAAAPAAPSAAGRR